MRWMVLAFAFFPALLSSQTRKQRRIIATQQKADEQFVSRFKEEFFRLTDENSISSQLPSAYIANQFQLAGLRSKGKDGYFQQVQIDKGKQIDAATFLKINGTQLAIKKEFFPLCYSASKSVNGMPAMALRERGVPWFVDVKDWLSENGKNAGLNINFTIRKEAARMAAKGATALFLYNSTAEADNLYFNSSDKTETLSIPVIYIKQDGYKKYLQDNSQVLDIELNVSLKEAKYHAKNVVGYVDNNAPATVAIASFYNTDLKAENTTDTPGRRLEDNAVSSAMLVELAKILSTSKAKNYNYVLAALDNKNAGAEPTDSLPEITTVTTPIPYLINLSNTSMYDDDKKLLISGYNGSALDSVTDISLLAEKPLEIGYSDRKNLVKAEAIRQDKSVVFSFVKASPENRDLSMDSKKINFEREMQITKFINSLINDLNAKSKFQGKKG